MKTLVSVAGMALVLGSAAALAQPDQAKGTMTQALESNEKNRAKNPGNKGLSNANTRLLNNARRHDAHQTAKANDRIERAERVERAERPERPERPDRPNRPERPERPDRPRR